jgi:sensor histidine kinase YesM
LWLAIAVLLTVILTPANSALSQSEAAAITVPMCLLYAFICQASWYLCKAVPLSEGALTQLLTTHIAAAFTSALIWFAITLGWAWLLEITIPIDGLGARYRAAGPVLFFAGLFLFVLTVAFNYILITFESSQVAEKKALELQVLAREAELKALRAQIDPHFLFNSLNSVSALVMADPASARRMCVLLADFFRGCLKLGSVEGITLAEEIQLAENYLDIEKVRLGERLIVEQEIETQCKDCRVPPLILQPLIENAIKHGIAPMIKGGTVRIEAKQDGGGVKIFIENPFEPDSSPARGAGVGIKNVRMRLANLFDGDARLDVNDNGQRFRVELEMPCL